MKISELIASAQRALVEYGDIEVAVNSVPIEYADEYVWATADVKSVQVTTDRYESKTMLAFVVD